MSQQKQSGFRSLYTDAEWDADGILVSIFVLLIFMMGMAVWNHDKFDPSSFGTGVATIFGGGGLGYAARRKGDAWKGNNDDDRSDSSLSKS
jgi:hypothetical protein